MGNKQPQHMLDTQLNSRQATIWGIPKLFANTGTPKWV